MDSNIKLNNMQCLAIASVLLVIIITVLDVFIINVALPVMADSLSISDSQSVWIVTVYQLAIIMLMLPLAYLGDIYGYRKVMLIGVGFFIFASGLCALSGNFATLLLSRGLQGMVNPGKLAAVGMMVFVIGTIWLIIGSSHGMSEIGIAIRMAICGIGFGLFQTPNNIVMIQSTPLSRSGAAGGMQGTARLGGQTFGATLVTIIFALSKESITVAVENCLIIAVLCGLAASVFSVSRKGTACK